MLIPEGTLKKVHVNGALLRSGKAKKPIAVVIGKQTKRASMVRIGGPSLMVFSPDKPLPTGATVWVQTYAEVEYA